MSQQSFLERVRAYLSSLFGTAEPSAPETPTIPATPTDDAPLVPIEQRVLVIHFDGIVDPASGTRLSKHPVARLWNNVDDLVAGYIADIDECSGGLVKYRVVERITADQFPVKEDGFRYDGPSYVNAIRTGNFHQPNWTDYHAIIRDFDLMGRVQRDEIDEVWLFGGPYDGYYESRMVGRGAFWINGPEIPADCRRFAIMGFNFERGVGEMLEDLGHRAESALARVFGVQDFLSWAYDRNRDPARFNPAQLAETNLFARFILYDQIAPGRAEVGTLHHAPNSVRDYDWGNMTPVLTREANWLNFPALDGAPKIETASAWGGGDIRLHHKWWFKRLPKIAGRTNGIRNNWWSYICDLANPEFDV